MSVTSPGSRPISPNLCAARPTKGATVAYRLRHAPVSSAALSEFDYITVGVMGSHRTPGGSSCGGSKKPALLARPRCRQASACEQRPSGNEKSEGSKVDFFDGSWVQHILANY